MSNYLLQVSLLFLLICCHTINNKNITKNKLEHGILINQSIKSEYKLYNSSKEYIIQYSSISGLDNTSRQDTAVLFLPKGLSPKKGWPLIVWNHGTTGINPKCAPSLNPRTARDEPYINTWLSLGFAVLSPDYPGLGSKGQHPYLNSKSEAFSILDAIKAIKNSTNNIDKNNIFLSGQSQGAHAAFSAAIYQPNYSPNIKFKYIILTGVPYFNRYFFARNSLSIPNNYRSIVYAIYLYLSAKQVNNKLIMEDYFDKKIIPYVKMGSTTCFKKLFNKVSNSNLKTSKLLKPKFLEIISMPTFKFEKLKIKSPVFVGSGTNDFDTTLSVQRTFINDLLQAGTKVKAQEYYGLNHSETLNSSLKDSIPLVLKHLKK